VAGFDAPVIDLADPDMDATGQFIAQIKTDLFVSAPQGNRNAWKHGAYSAETKLAVARLKAFAALVE
jgi:hypothetical protein